MAIPNPPDPFLEAQDDVTTSLRTAHSLHSSYLRIRSLASSATSPELTQARQELESALLDLGADIQDLSDSVKAIEGDPFKFGLDIEEVGRRRHFVKNVSDEVEGLAEELRSNVSSSGKGMGKGATANGTSGLPPPSAFDDIEGARQETASEDDYGAFEQQRQVEMMHDQDEQLDGVFRTVGNLRVQADTMGRELEEQAEMIDDVDHIADRVGGKLQNGIKRVGWVIKHNEGMYSLQGGFGSVHGVMNDDRFMVELLHWGLDPGFNYTTGASHRYMSCQRRLIVIGSSLGNTGLI